MAESSETKAASPAPADKGKAVSPAPEKAASPAAEKAPSPAAEASAAAGPSTTTPAAPVVENEPLEVDEGNQGVVPDDSDSAFEDRISAYTASLTSSVVNYPMEHGRRYHAFRAGAYQFPNDEEEMERLDMNHLLCVKIAGNKLYHSPIQEDKVHRILDIGTGTGIWAIEMGDLFPAAEVIGNDLSAIQPSWVPPNVKFEIDDIESPWVESARFDFIFSRYMVASITDWPRYVGNIYDHLNPGGWAEFQDYDLEWYADDGSMTPEHYCTKWIRNFVDACDGMGRTAKPGPKIEQWVKDAGFVNVVKQKVKVPVGPWPKDPVKKDIGMHNMIQVLEGLEAFTLKLFCGVLGWTEQEVTVLLAKVRSEMKSLKFHATYDYYIVYGQKPE